MPYLVLIIWVIPWFSRVCNLYYIPLNLLRARSIMLFIPSMQHHHYDDHHDRKHHKKHKNGHSRYHRHKFVLTFEENEYIEKEIAEKVNAEWKAIYREVELVFFW